MDDRHGAAAQHIGRADHERQLQIGDDETRLLDRISDAVLRLLETQLVEQALEAVAILGEINRVDGCAEDRRARLFDDMGELERGLAAELNDHAFEEPTLALLIENGQHILGGERLEIEPVRSVVVGRDGLRIAVDHDRLVPRRAQRERGVAAAIVELDPLPDPVWAAAEDDDLLALRRVGFASDLADERGLVGRIHVGRGRSELGRAGVDALEHRLNAEPSARRSHIGFGLAGKGREARVREAVRLERAHIARVGGQAVSAHLALERDDFGYPLEEPGVDLAAIVDLFDAHP